MKIEARKSPNQDVNKMIDEVINKIQQIDFWTETNTGCYPAIEGVKQLARPKRSAHTDGEKRKQYARLAKRVRTQLYAHAAKKETNKLSLRSYANALKKINKKIRLDVARNHPALPSLVDQWIAEYPQYSDIIRPIIEDKTKYVKKTRTAAVKNLIALRKVDSSELAEKIIDASDAGLMEHPCVNMLERKPAITKSERLELKADEAKRLQGRKDGTIGKRSYSLGFIDRITAECLDSSDFNELVIGVALATGRRGIEVIHGGSFKVVSEKSIKFSGQAKKGRGVKSKPYNIPVRFSAQKIVDAVDRLRSTKNYMRVLNTIAEKEQEAGKAMPEYHLEWVNYSCARMLNYTVKNLLADNDSDKKLVKFKDTRAIAVKVARLKIQPTTKITDDNEFVKKYAGHDGYAEFANYEHINIIDEPEQEVKPKAIAPASAPVDVLSAADKAVNDFGSKPVAKLHEKVKALAERTGWELTQSFIYKGKKDDNGDIQKAGGNLAVVKKYLAIPAVAKAVAAYNKDKQASAQSIAQAAREKAAKRKS